LQLAIGGPDYEALAAIARRHGVGVDQLIREILSGC